MKKLKLKIFVLMLTLALSCSCFLFAPKQMDVYAKYQKVTNLNQAKGSFSFSNDFELTDASYSQSSKSISYELFDSDTSSHYGIEITDVPTMSKECSKSLSQSTINVNILWYCGINVTTTVNITNSAIINAINNGAISAQLKANVSSSKGGMTLKQGSSEKSAGTGSNVMTEAMTLTQSSMDVLFYTESSSSYGNLEVTNPMLVINTNDVTAPVLDLAKLEQLKSTWNWENKTSRQVSFTINDSVSGIKSVKVENLAGNEISISQTSSSADTKSKTYTFDASIGESYRVVTTDNVNNTATYDLVSSDQLKLDTTSGILSINQIDTLHSSRLNVKFNYTSDNKSDEALYYRLVSEADYDESKHTPSATNFDGSLDVSMLDDQVTIPFGTIITSPIDNTNYILSAVVVDSVGNVSEVSTQTFKYDSRRFAVIVLLDGGTLDSLNGCETLDELFEEVPHAWPGTRVEFGYSALDGYQFYKLTRFEIAKNEDGTLATDEDGNYIKIGQGQELSSATISTGYKYSCENDYIYEVKFRYIVQLSTETTQYDYAVDESGEGLTQRLQFALNDIVSESGEPVITIDRNLIEIEYVLNGNIVDGLKDAGNYTINWRVIDNDDFVGSGSLLVTVNPKVITLIYKDYENLVYSQNSQTILVECDTTNLNASEIQLLGQELQILYFDADDLEFASPMSAMINAGSYVARVTLSNVNYTIYNSTCDIAVAKKTVEVTNILKNTFAYNASKQMIEYELSEDIETIVVYYIADESSSVADFVNAGEYLFEILPVDSGNYILANNTGSAEITVVNVYFRLNKSNYDYTGMILSLNDLKFQALDSYSENASEIEVNGLYFEAYDKDGNLTDLCDPQIYKILLKTSDANYILFNNEFDIEIKITIIDIQFTKNVYEYTGSNIELEYVIKNDAGEILSEVNGLSIEIKRGDEIVGVDGILEIATYSYKFVASDPKFELKNDQGEIEVITAQLSVKINSLTYSYSQDGYDIDYSVTSAFGADYKDKVRFVISQEGTECILTNVGTYDFDVVFASDTYAVGMQIESICDLNDQEITNKIITIIPAEVWLDVVREYTYSGDEIEITYAMQDILDPSEISIVYDTILTVGDYECTISSLNPNYIVRVQNSTFVDGITTCQIRVVPCKVYISEHTDRYIYTGSEIDLIVTLTNENLTFATIAMCDGSETQIINAGEYTVTFVSNDDNYEIVGSITIVVDPKQLSIVLDNNSISQTYNRDVKAIEYAIFDGEEKIEVASQVVYFMNGEQISPINVGNYEWRIDVTDRNYIASLVSTQDNNLVICKKHATLVVKPNQYKSYGSQDGVIEYTLTGVCAGDSLQIDLQRESGESVGRYVINLVDFQNDNYEIDYTTEYYRVSPKRLIIIADRMTKTFGDQDPKLTFKMYMDGSLVTKLIGEDTLEGMLTRVEGEDVGSYLITIGSISNANYNIVFSEDYLFVNPRPIDVVLQDKTVTYGSSTQLTYVVQGDYDPRYILGEPTREAGDLVGQYIISGGTLSSYNYQLNITNGTYTITKAPLTVRAIACSKVYGQQDNLEYTVDGLIGSDMLEGTLSRESGEDVGIYAITLGSIYNPNYDITFVPNNLIITRANLEIVIDDKTQVYGQEQAKLTYTISGLQYDDTVTVNLMKTGSNNAGVYKIVGDFEIPNNYALTKYETGTYTIEKATVVPVLSPKTFVYSGKECLMTCDNLDLPLRYVYKRFGMVVDSAIDAGTYKVQAYFDGNENYNVSVSAEADLVIEQQLVFFTLTQTEFIYDGSIKYPVYTFDKTIGLTEHQIEFTFQNDLKPIEVGEYHFEMKVKDGLNYKGTTQGTIKIQNAFVVKDGNGIIECNDATFDENVQQIKLVQNTDTKKFNNEKVLSVCTLENADALLDSGYVYTVKVKATQGVDTVKVYKVGLSGFSEIAIKVENGYYVFQVDDLNNKYIITTEVKTLSTLAWILILVAVALAFSITLIVVAKKKHKKAKVASKVSDKDIETYNAN